MGRLGIGAFLALALGGCDADGTVNNGGVRIPLTLRASLSAFGVEGNGYVDAVHVSGDGRRVAFACPATNLHAGDTDTIRDIYVKEMATGAILLASRSDGAAGAKGTDWSGYPRLSADGRRVAFQSSAPLDPADSGNDLDVYVRDLEANETILVSRANGPAGAKGNGMSYLPDISADGRFVVFISSATTLSPDDADAGQDVYLRDLLTGATELISRPTGAGGKADGESGYTRVSGDGSRVVFQSTGKNLGGGTSGLPKAYVRDRGTLETRLASRASGASGAPADRLVSVVDISDDGRFVVFDSEATNLHPDDVETFSDIFLRDLDTDTTELISRASGANGVDAAEHCYEPSVSSDGRYVAFSSAAANLVPGDSNQQVDIFVRDRALNNIARVSVRTFGGESVGESRTPSISSDGKAVVFMSAAGNLVDDDGNSTDDAFYRAPLW